MLTLTPDEVRLLQEIETAEDFNQLDNIFFRLFEVIERRPPLEQEEVLAIFADADCRCECAIGNGGKGGR
jgi:hypothetical protein